MRPILQMQDITKTFPGVRALSGVNLSIAPAEIHGVVGENGAGKSTLMKVLSGVYPHGDYEGVIRFEGQQKAFRSLADSERSGIVIIHQELALVPLLSIAENLFLGGEIARNGVIDQMASFARARELMAKVGLKEHPGTLVGDIGVGKQQLVEIAKALNKNVKLLILDEPTSSLNETDSAALLDLLREFRAQGISSILITHKLNEVLAVADRITVLRDGASVDTMDCADGSVDQDRIIRAMVGRDMHDLYPKRAARIGEVAFEIENWRVRDPHRPEREAIRGVSLNVRAGEVVGVAGLMGAGRTELAMSIFGRSWGLDVRGTAKLKGREADLSSVPKAVEAGLAYVTEDRKTFGLVLIDDIRHNVTLAHLDAVAARGVIDDLRETKVANDYRASLRIRSSSVYQATMNLSGGNQQKVVLAKWLFAGPDVLILDEPTRGIDVGAKYEIYTLINQLAEQGKAIIVISSEMPELLGLSDRIYVMNEGAVVAETPIAQASQESIMRAIMKSWESAK